MTNRPFDLEVAACRKDRAAFGAGTRIIFKCGCVRHLYRGALSNGGVHPLPTCAEHAAKPAMFGELFWAVALEAAYRCGCVSREVILCGITSSSSV
jgi:hypothetical protein